MKSLYRLLTALAIVATPAFAQDATTATTTRKTTVKTADGKTVTYTGTVTEYVPHKSLVIRDSSQKVVTYTLTPDLVVPEDVRIGQTVTIYAEPGNDGSVVRKVTATEVTDDGKLKTTTRSTRTGADGSSVTSTGTVVSFVPKKTIVIRDADNHRVTYHLGPEVMIPVDVQIGKTVTVYTDEEDGGKGTVSKVTTTSVTPEGDVKTSTRTTETSADGSTMTTEESTIEGVVSAYQASKTVTVQRPDGTTVTYLLDGSAAVPSDLAIGKRVMLRVSPSGEKRIVRKITYTTTTKY